jgi:hypothetical protein
MKVSNKCKLGNFSITEECDCEHCGTLKPFSVTWSNGGTWYCLDCCRYDKDFKITHNFYRKLLKIQKQKAKEYCEEQIKDVENQTKLY